MATQSNIQKSINLLAVAQDSEIHWSYSHNINNQTDLDNISVEDNKSFNFTFADVETKANELENEKQADATNKANGNQKLLDLGLTQAEATALTGYTPPSED